jgi:hypothetical protein
MHDHRVFFNSLCKGEENFKSFAAADFATRPVATTFITVNG